MLLSTRLARYVTETGMDAFTPQTVRAAKQSILDTLAVAWAGTAAAGCTELHRLHGERGGRAESHSWGRAEKLPTPAAALVNGMAAAALDFDAMHGGFHADGCTLAAALAVAEGERRSGRELLRAFVLGSDLSCRIASSCHVKRLGWWDTPLIAGFGCAAAAGLLLGLDAERIAHAIGLVFGRTGGTLQLNVDQSLAKRLAMGLAAESGVHAAFMARAGITGPAAVFEGEFGFSRVYAPVDSAVLLHDLGTTFAAGAMTFKPYPSCGCTHTAITATLELVREQGLEADDIASVSVTISPYMHALVGADFDPDGTEVAAQFSVQYAVACALHRGGFSLAELEPAAMRDPAVLATARKTRVLVDEGSDSDRACSVTLTVAGASFTRSKSVAPGSPQAPLDAASHAAKVADCFSRGVRPMRADAIERVVRAVQGLENLPLAGDLMKECERACA